MKKTIAVLPGDGVGPEVTREAQAVLQKVAEVFGHTFTFESGLIGSAAIDATGEPLPKATLDLCLRTDAILFGAIGDPKYDNNPAAKVRPEQGLLGLRQALGLYANIRPIFPFAVTAAMSPLKPEVIKDVDFVVIRELTGGIYFGQPRKRSEDGKRAVDTCVYTAAEILRVAKVAFELAQRRRHKVTLVDKANVLETSRLWREVVKNYASQWPSITLEYLFVDNAAMQIIKKPAEFDVILTENMFGDILTDEASVITGSLGMLPSASMGEKTALFEPIHGSYPKAAGQNMANPTGAILSAAMMLEYTFGLKPESEAVFRAVDRVLHQGLGTRDIVAEKPLSTQAMGEAIRKEINR